MYDLFGFLGAARVIAWAFLGILFVVATLLAIFDRGAKTSRLVRETAQERKAA
jgi:hypothetical protein